jgi:hypothetical protein
MSRQDVKDQAALLTRPGATVRCVDDGENVVVILEKYTPPNSEKYTRGKVDAPLATLDALAFTVPASFPDACPDPSGFYVKPSGIRLADSTTEPQNTGETTLLGETWRKFSWAPKGGFPWDPDRDTLETHLTTIEKRFRTGT